MRRSLVAGIVCCALFLAVMTMIQLAQPLLAGDCGECSVVEECNTFCGPNQVYVNCNGMHFCRPCSPTCQ